MEGGVPNYLFVFSGRDASDGTSAQNHDDEAADPAYDRTGERPELRKN